MAVWFQGVHNQIDARGRAEGISEPRPGRPIDEDDGAYDVRSYINLETTIKHST